MIVDGNNKLQFSELGERLEEPVIIGMLSRALRQKDMISLAAGFTDNAKLPKEIVTRALSELNGLPGYPDFLQYGTTKGRPGLREEIAKLVSGYAGEKKEAFDASKVIVSTGSQQTLYIAMQVLCNPGDIVLVEGPSYFVFLELLTGLGIRAMSMPMEETCQINFKKLDEWLGELDKKGEIGRIKATYLVSYFSNPSSRSMTKEDKVSLAKVLKKWGVIVPVLEDAAYRDLYYEQEYAVPSIFSIEEYDEFPKLYLGTFSKSFSSGFKVGYCVCSHERLLSKMVNVKGHHDFGSSNFNQALLEVVLSKGWFYEWVEGLHEHYRKKVEDFEVIAVREGLRELGWAWEKPKGGLMAWLRGPEGFDTSIGSPFYETCMTNGVFYVPGNLCYAEGEPRNCVRLSLGTLSEKEMAEGIRRFASSMRQVIE